MSRALAAGWLVVATAVWNGCFDLYIARGTTAYLQRQAEFEAGLGPEPAMAAIMATTRHDGALAATAWALFILACGWATARVRRPRGPATGSTT